MITRIIDGSLRQRPFIMVALLVLIVSGTIAALRLPVDAVPDITNVQVQINTAVPALAPEEIEQQVTFPVESEMSGLPGLLELRSLSKFGLSQVTLVFADGTDIYRARQLVSERLQTVLGELPDGLAPALAPISTGLGEIFYYSLDYAGTATNKPASRVEQLMNLRQVQEYLIKPLLRQTPGVAEVNTSGGYEKQIVVKPDSSRLLSAGVTFTELANKIEENTRNAGGGLLDVGGEQIVVRAGGRVSSAAEIEGIPVKFTARPTPLLVRDLATVEVGSSFRTGASTRDGQEALLGATIMMAGENSRLVARAVGAKLKEIQAKLPADLVIEPVYDRSNLVNATIRTVEKNLGEGALLVVVILFLLLGNIRGAFIVALIIPLSLLAAMLGMVRLGIPGNLMSLGAIDFGLIIDGAVVMVENILRHLGERQHQLGRRLTVAERLEEVGKSAREVAGPMYFGVLIITVVYVPILALQGIEGKMFRPMAMVVMLALGAALVLALTLVPVLCTYLLGGNIREGDNAVVRAVKAVYRPLLAAGLRVPALVGIAALALFVWSGVAFRKLGSEFIPQLDEGSFALQMIRSSSAGLASSLALQERSEAILRAEFPEITECFSRIGTAEIATDPMGPNVSDTYIMLKKPEEWRKVDGRPITKAALGNLMLRTLADQVPGQGYLLTQPIQLRFNEIMAGARADLICKIFGDQFETLERLAGEVQTVLATLPGSGDVGFDAIGRNPMLEIQPDKEALRRYNLHVEDVNRVVETALAGREVGELVDGNRRTPVVVRLSDSDRGNVGLLRRLPVGTDEGGLLTLGRVASITNTLQIGTVARENAQRRVGILINVRGRDTAGFVAEAEKVLHEKIKFPDGYYFEFGGQFKNLMEAKARLRVVVPLALALIFILLTLSFGNFRQAALVFLCVPLAVTGGVWALVIRDMPFTISAGVGFIALSGIAVLNGIMLVSFINQLRAEGTPLRKAVVDGTLTRLRPKLMTALTAALGLVPMAIAHGPGAEVQRPLATVIIGGIVTSTILTLLVLPVLYDWMETRNRKGNAT
jgi:cobalt-zinc-cadmium resistance protein CzcA